MTSRPDEQRFPPAGWLDGCVGFVVESAAGRLGRVVEVQRDVDSGRPVALVLRAGMAGTRRFVVPAGEVAGVLSSSGRIILEDSTPPVALEDPWEHRSLSNLRVPERSGDSSSTNRSVSASASRR